MLNRVCYIVFFIFLCCCNKNVKKPFTKEEKEKEPLYTQINNVIDSMSSSFPKEYSVNLYTVTHEKTHGNDYVRIATSQFYNKDSISGSYLHNGKTVVLYSKKFFKNNNKNKFKPDNALEYKNETISLYHPQYTIFKITDNTYKNISLEEAMKMNLFNYSDRYIPEPAPSIK
ncbi:hypothetical protein [Chryseobacterium sp. MYb328]|uniref:hypothetical protein n=1 Tax=Chryseobacterium sp. MYb328 TaxID=2745231 RepID=UPI0030B00CB0